MDDSAVKKLKRLWPHMIYQSLFAVIFICVVLYFMNLTATSDLLWAVGAGSLSSSSFIVFGHPSGVTASPKNIIIGYLVGIFTGIMVRIFLSFLPNPYLGGIGTAHFQIMGMSAALAVGIALFLMAALKVEHPPAVGIALVLVIDIRDYLILTIIFAAVLILAWLKILLRRWLIDLY